MHPYMQLQPQMSPRTTARDRWPGAPHATCAVTPHRAKRAAAGSVVTIQLPPRSPMRKARTTRLTLQCSRLRRQPRSQSRSFLPVGHGASGLLPPRHLSTAWCCPPAPLPACCMRKKNPDDVMSWCMQVEGEGRSMTSERAATLQGASARGRFMAPLSPHSDGA